MMQLTRYLRFAARTHALFAPALLVVMAGSIFAVLMATTEGGEVRAELPLAQIVGTLMTFVGLPGYLLATVPAGQRLSAQSLDQLAPSARDADVTAARLALSNLGRWPLGVAFGLTLGLSQNPLFIERMWRSGVLHPLDVGFLVGACMTWTAVGLILCWRLPVSRAFSDLGRHITLDLYRLDALRPLSRVANTDVLVVAGAMAFTPLQSLDAQFRFGNYYPAIMVGVPAAVFLFIRPLWGVRTRIIAAKRERLAELRAVLDQTDRADVSALETITAHIERVRRIPNWPVDIELLTRLFGYVIIPPLAWVAAAVVERFIDRL